MTDFIMTDDEIDTISAKFIKSVGDSWYGEEGIRFVDIDDFAREIEAAVINKIKETK